MSSMVHRSQCIKNCSTTQRKTTTTTSVSDTAKNESAGRATERAIVSVPKAAVGGARGKPRELRQLTQRRRHRLHTPHMSRTTRMRGRVASFARCDDRFRSHIKNVRRQDVDLHVTAFFGRDERQRCTKTKIAIAIALNHRCGRQHTQRSQIERTDDDRQRKLEHNRPFASAARKTKRKKETKTKRSKQNFGLMRAY
jgi:hypothetical protein